MPLWLPGFVQSCPSSPEALSGRPSGPGSCTVLPGAPPNPRAGLELDPTAQLGSAATTRALGTKTLQGTELSSDLHRPPDHQKAANCGHQRPCILPGWHSNEWQSISDPAEGLAPGEPSATQPPGAKPQRKTALWEEENDPSNNSRELRRLQASPGHGVPRCDGNYGCGCLRGQVWSTGVRNSLSLRSGICTSPAWALPWHHSHLC